MNHFRVSDSDILIRIFQKYEAHGVAHSRIIQKTVVREIPVFRIIQLSENSVGYNVVNESFSDTRSKSSKNLRYAKSRLSD